VKPTVIVPILTTRAASTVVAALRVFKAVIAAQGTYPRQAPQTGKDVFSVVCHADNIVTLITRDLSKMEYFQDVEPLTAAQIDELCEQITTAPKSALNKTKKALRKFNRLKNGDSGDAEHDAAVELAASAEELIKSLEKVIP